MSPHGSEQIFAVSVSVSGAWTEQPPAQPLAQPEHGPEPAPARSSPAPPPPTGQESAGPAGPFGPGPKKADGPARPASSHPNNGARSRRERPCDACRRRKSRCVLNEGSSVCVLCDFHSQECTFIESPQPRKRKAAAAAAAAAGGLPSRPGAGLQNAAGADVRLRNVSSPMSVATAPAALSSATVLPGPTSTVMSAAAAARQQRPPRPSSSATNLRASRRSSLSATPVQQTQPSVPPFEGDTLGFHRSKTSRFFGFTTPNDPLLLEFTTFGHADEVAFSNGTIRRVAPDACFMMNSFGQNGDVIAVNQRLIHEIETVAHPYGILGNGLLTQLFFRIVHPHFPVIHRNLFMAMADSRDSALSPAVLAAMYFVVLTWWDNPTYNPDYCNKPAPNVDLIKSIALRALSMSISRPQLSTIQAGLLLLQKLELTGATAASKAANFTAFGGPYNAHTQQGPAATFDGWLLTSQLMAISQELGLHLDCSLWAIPAWEKGIRRRLAWALYMQDKWSSLVYGRPSHVVDSEWAVDALEPPDFLETDHYSFNLGDGSVLKNGPMTTPPPSAAGSSEPPLSRPGTAPAFSTGYPPSVPDVEVERGQAVFVEFVRLTMIMGEILALFYTQASSKLFQTSDPTLVHRVLERAKPVQIRLKEWYSALPVAVRMDGYTPGLFSSTGSLHLAYFATEMTLHRRIIQSLARAVVAKEQRSFNVPSDPPKVSMEPTAGAYISHICRSAAKTRLISALDFTNRLKSEHLQSFWYFPSSINYNIVATFGCLLWATAPALEEAEFYRTRLTEFRWTLNVSRRKISGPVCWLDSTIWQLDANGNALEMSLASKLPVSELVKGRPQLVAEGGLKSTTELGMTPMSMAPSSSVSSLAEGGSLMGTRSSSWAVLNPNQARYELETRHSGTESGSSSGLINSHQQSWNSSEAGSRPDLYPAAGQKHAPAQFEFGGRTKATVNFADLVGGYGMPEESADDQSNSSQDEDEDMDDEDDEDYPDEDDYSHGRRKRRASFGEVLRLSEANPAGAGLPEGPAPAERWDTSPAGPAATSFHSARSEQPGGEGQQPGMLLAGVSPAPPSDVYFQPNPVSATARLHVGPGAPASAGPDQLGPDQLGPHHIGFPAWHPEGQLGQSAQPHQPSWS